MASSSSTCFLAHISGMSMTPTAMYSCLLHLAAMTLQLLLWDFAATKVRLGMECLKLSSIGAVIVDHLDQRAGVQSEGETAMTTRRQVLDFFLVLAQILEEVLILASNGHYGGRR